jgi:UrcA family protein
MRTSYVQAPPVPHDFPKSQELNMSNNAGIWINAAIVLMAGAWLSDARATEPRVPADIEVSRTTVNFADLNIDTPQGASALHRRIRHAAQGVCGDPQPPGSHMTSPAWRSCVAQSIDRAVTAVDRPALTAYHRLHLEHSDRQVPTVLASSSQKQQGSRSSPPESASPVDVNRPVASPEP